jgi:hypothetical protein
MIDHSIRRKHRRNSISPQSPRKFQIFASSFQKILVKTTHARKEFSANSQFTTPEEASSKILNDLFQRVFRFVRAYRFALHNLRVGQGISHIFDPILRWNAVIVDEGNEITRRLSGPAIPVRGRAAPRAPNPPYVGITFANQVARRIIGAVVGYDSLICPLNLI